MSAKKAIKRTWIPTSSLRWRVPIHKDPAGDESGFTYVKRRGRPILEQEWVCRETGELEWKGIPVVENDVQTGELL